MQLGVRRLAERTRARTTLRRIVQRPRAETTHEAGTHRATPAIADRPQGALVATAVLHRLTWRIARIIGPLGQVRVQRRTTTVRAVTRRREMRGLTIAAIRRSRGRTRR